MIGQDRILGEITDHYLGSHDFNGKPLQTLSEADEQATIDAVTELVERGRVEALFSDVDANPSIKRFGAIAKDEIIRRLRELSSDERCILYPSSAHLEEAVAAADMIERPYSRLLALGEPQLAVRSFDLSVLEYYRMTRATHTRATISMDGSAFRTTTMNRPR